MTIWIVEGSVSWLNSFPPKDIVLDTLIPATIVIGKPNEEYNKKILVFGFYTIVFIGTNNTIKIMSVPGIDLKDSK